MSREQKADLRSVAGNIREAGLLDFVAGWYFKAANILRANPAIHVAFVSTNSLAQGEQPGILWDELLDDNIEIVFAHRTFKWTNDARGIAAVYCVIVGFGVKPTAQRRIFDYPDIRGEPVEAIVRNINPYLVDAPNVTIRNRQHPLADVPEMSFGNMPADGGHLILKEQDRRELLSSTPQAESFIYELLGARELIQGTRRWCLWLVNAAPEELRAMPAVLERIEKVRETRKSSSRPHLAETPTLFAQVTHNPQEHLSALAIPGVSSERRTYIPMRLIDNSVVSTNLVHVIPDATLYHFGILTSAMHMDWMRSVCGRLESRYRYSKDIVYNNFPWPEGVTDTQRANIEVLAQAVLDARERYPDSTLADLYDPLTMPPDLTKAHHTLDRAVDRLYRKKPFATDKDRLELLFKRYRQLTEE